MTIKVRAKTSKAAGKIGGKTAECEVKQLTGTVGFSDKKGTWFLCAFADGGLRWIHETNDDQFAIILN